MEFVKTYVDDRICYIILNRPEKRNALNRQFVNELQDSFDAAALNEHIRAIILKAEGEVFCAGADLDWLKQLQQFSFAENLDDSMSLKRLYQTIYNIPKPVIAQVEGHALAGGCGLITVCDIVFSVPNARFGYTETRIGFVPAIVLNFLLRKINGGTARELVLTAELISAHKAHEIGLVNHLTGETEIDKHVDQYVRDLIKHNSGMAMASTKMLLAELSNMSLEDGLVFAATENAKARGSEDCKKGISNFLNKLPQVW